jgi:hypothetical protein
MSGRPALKSIIGKTEALVFSAYACVVAFMTWPAITLLNRTYAQRGDPFGAIWQLWWFRYAYQRHLPAGLINVVSVPYGMKISVYGRDPLTNLTLRSLSIATTETIAYNLFLLFCFFLTAVTMYYLARRLTGSKPAAAVAGFIFAFSPYMLVQGKEHTGLLTVFWLPVFFYLLVRSWQERRSCLYVLCGVSFALMALTNYHYGLIGGTVAIVFLISVWLLGRPWKRRVRGNIARRSVPVLVFGAVVLGLFVLALFVRRWGARDIGNLYLYSARPWDYFLPHADGLLLGWATKGFINSHLHGGFLSENSLFLGFLPLALSAYALVETFRRPRSEDPGGVVEAEGPGVEEDVTGHIKGFDRRIPLALTISAAACFLMSMPPTAKILGLKIYLPSYLAHLVVPQVRAFARFGVGVMFSVALLAAYGLAFLLARKEWRKYSTVVTVAVVLVVLFEFSIVPPFRALDTKATTDYYTWLKERPGDPVVAIYPFYYVDDFVNYEYFFQQRHHEKKLTNGTSPGTDSEKIRQDVLNIMNPDTSRILKRLGARYVLVIPSLYAQGNHMNYVDPVSFNPAVIPPGLEKVREFDDGIIYENVASPADFLPLFISGTFQAIVHQDGSTWHPGLNEMVVNIKSFLPEPTVRDVTFSVASTKSDGTVEAEINGVSSPRQVLPVWPVEIALKRVTLRPGDNRMVIRCDSPLSPVPEVPRVTTVDAAIMVSDVKVTEPGSL